jgi:molecular chaperone GrpE
MSGEDRKFDDRGTDTEQQDAQTQEQQAGPEDAQAAAENGQDGSEATAAGEPASAEKAGAAEQHHGSSETDEIAELRARVKELEDENSELKDQYLRKQADFENFRKRMSREKADAIAYANKQLLLDIVTIIDDFERAIKSAEESRDFDSFHEGVALIEKQFTSMLERKWGLKRFDSEGEEFDPQKHEAVMTDEDADHDKPVVVEDYQKGYFLNDKVLRSAKVKVAVPNQEKESS